VAQDEAMGDVIDQLRRNFPGRIVLTDETLAGRPITGVYNLADPVEALPQFRHGGLKIGRKRFSFRNLAPAIVASLKGRA
jgi:hypothetical protein